MYRIHFIFIYVILLLAGCGGATDNSTPPPYSSQPISGQTQPDTADKERLLFANATYFRIGEQALPLKVFVAEEIEQDGDRVKLLINRMQTITQQYSGKIALNTAPLILADTVSFSFNVDNLTPTPIIIEVAQVEQSTHLFSSELLFSVLAAKRSQLFEEKERNNLYEHAFLRALVNAIAEKEGYPLLFSEPSEIQNDWLDLFKQEKNKPIAEAEYWLTGNAQLPENAAVAILSQAIQNHLTQYPALDIYALTTLALSTLDSQLTLQPKPLQTKNEVWVRTPDISDYDQVPTAELQRQANKYPHSYYLEGPHFDKTLALTFDDGPSIYTSQILQILKDHNVKASFFLLGQNIEARSHIVKHIHEQGHLIANHTWTHPNTQLVEDMGSYWSNEIETANQLIHSITGYMPSIYRPPYGKLLDEQVEFLSERGMHSVLWSIDTRDWHPNLNSVDSIVNAVINNKHAGAIVLMHDGGGNRENTVTALEEIITSYKEAGYKFVTLDEMFGVGKGR